MPLKEKSTANIFWNFFKNFPGISILLLFNLPFLIKLINKITQERITKELTEQNKKNGQQL